MGHRESKARKELIEILKPFSGYGVEVGVQEGNFSRELLENLPGLKKLFMVDAWREMENYRDIANVNNNFHGIKMLSALQNTEEFQDRRSIFCETSIEASWLFEADRGGWLDFVYLDAAHDFQSVTDDLDAWFPTITAGGIFCGDDFLDDENNIHANFGVKSAVEKFCKEYNKELNVIEADGEMSQWWFKI